MKRPVLFLLCGALLALPSPIDAQTPRRDEGNRDPRLRIDSPRDGAVVASGETLQVTVSSPNRTRFVGITVVMEDPIETTDLEATSLPARFAIKIPKDIAPGSYITAVGAGTPRSSRGTVRETEASRPASPSWYGDAQADNPPRRAESVPPR